MGTQGMQGRVLLVVCLGGVMSLGWCSFAGATSLGANITISDQVYQDTYWYGNHEDQEVEPNCVTNQGWDLEGFLLKGSTLSVVGGFNFVAGNEGVRSGDLFLDVDGDAEYGSSNSGGGLGTRR